MDDRHLAVLMAINDSFRSDVRMIAEKLVHRSEDEAIAILGELADHLSTPTRQWPTYPALRVALSDLLGKRLSDFGMVIEAYRKEGIRILPFWDRSYPARLRAIPNPPLILYVHGSVFPGERPVAIVGTRSVTPSGRHSSRLFGRGLAERGFTVVSGLAKGVDTQSHLGALEGGGPTLAVLAGHVGHIYPSENKGLADRIIGNGALVSEISPLIPTTQARFVERNRITSGLSEAVVIAEFLGSGGTLQQVRFALSQRIPLFVIDQGQFDTDEALDGYRGLVSMGAIPANSPEVVADWLSGEKSVPRMPPPPPRRRGRAVQSRLPAG